MTVSGLTIPEAAHSRGTSESISQTLVTAVTAYCAQAPFIVWKQTLLPTNLSFYGLPALTISPHPSSPATNGTFAAPYAPLTLNLSDGLMVEAVTLIRTSLAAGWGISKSVKTGTDPRA